jgi:hypothetical protein
MPFVEMLDCLVVRGGGGALAPPVRRSSLMLLVSLPASEPGGVSPDFTGALIVFALVLSDLVDRSEVDLSPNLANVASGLLSGDANGLASCTVSSVDVLLAPRAGVRIPGCKWLSSRSESDGRSVDEGCGDGVDRCRLIAGGS